MKLLAIPVLILSLVSLSFSMEPEIQSVSQPTVDISETRQRIDGFVEALKEMEVTDDKDDRVLLNFRHSFFTSYARELVAEPHGKALDDECRKALNEIITECSSKEEVSFQELYALCLFTVTMLSQKLDISWNDSIHDRSRTMLNAKENYKKDYGNLPFYRDFFYNLLAEQASKDSKHIPFITTGTQHKFYPFFLINNSFFKMEDYLYALSKRVHILSLPYKPCKSLHGGFYSEPVEVLFHDIAHLVNYTTNVSGSCPLVFWTLSKDDSTHIFNMHERVGQYFFDLLQRENIDDNSKKKLKEVGFNLTHEGENRKKSKIPTDSTLKSDLRYLITSLRDHLENVALPDCLKNTKVFRSSLSKTYIDYLKQQHSKELSAKLNKNLVSVDEGTKKYTYILTYKDGFEVTVNYDFRKRLGVDWVKSAQRAGYTGKISENDMDYDPTPARNFHFSLLTWFEKNYLSKL